ncbi:hypothetical protein [Flagellimonas amoyensis]|uniref:hypothetical protein n=1 Tax=Flagellimonas amoyensis TaxID=2169401 RepID=UPI000D37180E|nr:hypothetical protein [Allomuricauda amoyensis]
MKKYFLFLGLFIAALNLQAQDVAVGDTFEIGRPDSPQYAHLEFPRANFIVKRGGIANYKSVEGQKVVVTSIKEKKDGTKVVKIKRADGNRFFGSHWSVAANVEKALESGELLKI